MWPWRKKLRPSTGYRKKENNVKPRTWCLCLGLVGVLPWPAFSQQPSRPAQSGTFADVVGSVAQLESDQQKTAELRRYEEIEIMRRILEQRIRRLAALPRGNLSLSRPGNKVSDHNGAAFLDFDNDGDLDI